MGAECRDGPAGRGAMAPRGGLRPPAPAAPCIPLIPVGAPSDSLPVSVIAPLSTLRGSVGAVLCLGSFCRVRLSEFVRCG